MDFTWRSRARFVACFQLAFLVLSLFLVIVLGLILCDETFYTEKIPVPRGFKLHLTSILNELEENLHHFKGKFINQFSHYLSIGVPIYFWWIAYLTFVAVTGLQWWMFEELWWATKIGTHPKKALRSATVWRNLTAGFIALAVLIFLVCLYAVLNTTGELYRTAALIVTVSIFVFDFHAKCCCFYVVNEFVNELGSYSQVSVI